MGSGERVVVSICVSCVNTSDGVERRRPDSSSRKMEISVGSVGFRGVPSVFRRMECSVVDTANVPHDHKGRGASRWIAILGS